MPQVKATISIDVPEKYNPRWLEEYLVSQIKEKLLTKERYFTIGAEPTASATLANVEITTDEGCDC